MELGLRMCGKILFLTRFHSEPALKQFQDCPKNKSACKPPHDGSEIIAMACIKCLPAGGSDFLPDRTGNPPSKRLMNIASLVNEAGNSRVGGTRNAFPGFNGAQSSIQEMLLVTGCIAPPAIVGDDENKIRAVADVLSDIFAVNRFVADHRRNSGSLR